MHVSLAAMWCVTPFVCWTGRRNKCLSWSTMWVNNIKPVAKNINNACTSFTIIKSGISGIIDHQWHLPPPNWLKLPKWTYMTYILPSCKPSTILFSNSMQKRPPVLWSEYMQICHEQNTHVTNKNLLYLLYILYIYYKHLYILYTVQSIIKINCFLCCPAVLQPVQKHELQEPPWVQNRTKPYGPQEMWPWMALMKNKMQKYFEMFM